MSFLRSNSIKARVLKQLILAIGIVAVIFISVWRLGVEPALRREVGEQQKEIAQRAADEIDNFIGDRIQELSITAEIGRFWEARPDEQKQALYRLMKRDPQIWEIAVTDATGQEVLRLSRMRAYTEADLISHAQEEKFRRAIQGERYIGHVFHGMMAEPFITLAVPIRFTADAIRGVIIAEVSLKTLWNAVSNIKVGKSGHLFVVDQRGTLIAHPDYSKVLLGLNLSHIDEVKELLRFGAEDPDVGEIQSGMDGKQVLTNHALVPGPHWGVIVEEPLESALRDVRQVERLAAIALLLTLAGVVAFSIFFSSRIARPMRQLEQGAKLIAQGDLEQKLDIRTGDEIESLAHEFNRMAEALKESYQGLEQKIAERTRDLSALYAAMAPLASASAHDLLQLMVERLKESTHADAAAIRILDQETKSFFYPAHIGFSSEFIESTRILREGSAVAQAFATGEPIIVADIAEDSRMTVRKQLEAGFRSCAFLPLRISGQFRGVIHLASRENGGFNQDKTEHLMAIARQMGIAMENHELFEQSQQRAREEAALSAVAMAVSQSLNLETLFKIALDKITEVTWRERVNIRLKDRLTGEIKLVAYRGFSEQEIEELRRMAPHPPTERVFASGKPLILNKSDKAGVTRSAGLLEKTQSVAWIPIKAESKVLGALGISDSESKPFLPNEVRLIEAMGSILGVAIENARLFGETKRNFERIRALREIDLAITSTLNIESVLRVLLEKMDLFLPGAVVAVTLINQSTGELEPVACRNIDEHVWMERSRKGLSSLPKLVLEHRVPFALADIRTDSRCYDPDFAREHGLVSYLGVPLIAKAKPLGVIGFFTKEEHCFSDEEVELLSTIAGQSAIAIQNAQLYEQTKHQAAALERANQAKDEFLSVTSHELRTPLNVVLGYSQMLKEGMFGDVVPEQEKALETIMARSRDQLTMINSILRVTQIEAGAVSVECEETHLAELLDEIRSGYAIPLDKELTIEWQYASDLPVIEIDRDKLKHVLENLINNALKFTERGKVFISALWAPDSRVIKFTVADTGVGISKEKIPFIFEMFHQIDSSVTRKYEGMGIGLYIAKKFTELLGGSIEVESEPGRGSRFTVTVPVLRQTEDRSLNTHRVGDVAYEI